jgi:hypothetical protein
MCRLEARPDVKEHIGKQMDNLAGAKDFPRAYTKID